MEAKDWDRIAEIYHQEVISPFYGKVENPLYDELKKIRGKNKKSVAEFGCGLFCLGRLLSKNFKEVHASDFSQKMVELAREKAKSMKNVVIIQEDLREINYKNQFDVVISVNSIIMPSLKDRLIAFENIYNSLKKKGQLLMILPSMESLAYYATLLLYDEIKRKDEKFAINSAKKEFENSKYDFFLGIYNDGGEKQKFFYESEIRYLMKKMGFKNIKINKVLYPWEKDISDFKTFPGEERLWDWFISARK